jgi:deoxyribodipyrimidine photo-lyase
MICSYQELLHRIDSIDVEAYAKTRNHLDGAVSRLSPYITRGVLPLPLIRDRILARCTPAEAEKFIQELAWREYFQNVWWEKGDAILSDLRFPRTDWSHHELVTAVVDAATGVDVLDTATRRLYETGYLHNHERMWLASVSTNSARAHWWPMSRWMYYYLRDGDIASNSLSWQWVAGTSVNKQYVCNQDLINACSGTTQHGTWLDVPREMVLAQNIPEHLTHHEPYMLSTVLPDTSDIPSLAGETVHLYHPWHLDPVWRMGEATRQILVLEPSHFTRFPVAETVIDFIVRQGVAVLPNLEVYVGEVSDLPGMNEAAQCVTRAYPAIRHWPTEITQDPVPRLFPFATEYYPSFFAYWQAVQAQVRV